MVPSLLSDFDPASFALSAWVPEGKGFGLVFASIDLPHDCRNLQRTDYPPDDSPPVSIVICTYGRPRSLNEALESLSKQTYRDFELILITEKGDLSRLRDVGLRFAAGDIVTFIDDDVYCPPTWLQSVVEAFKKEGVVGVSGPTVITDEYRQNRDLFKYKWVSALYERIFIGEVAKIPGHLSKCGANSLRSNSADCSYEGRVDYLEACNMSVKRKEAIDAGGFDHNYKRTSEWCEVDLALKIKERGELWFSRSCLLYHRPSTQGIYRARISTQHRVENFIYFQRKWIGPSLKRHLYWIFVWTYLKLKQLGWV